MNIQEGQISGVGGTSAATPMIAGMVALLNDWRFNQGKPSLGFIAPLFYQAAAEMPTSFTDITTGSNQCTVEACCQYGYYASTSWDPVSGLGSPNFQVLQQYINSLGI